MLQTSNQAEISSLKYLEETKLLDYNSVIIANLVTNRGWREYSEEEKIRCVYNFVKDEIRFGYNETDRVPASKVLEEGYGQCNTKNTLFMALLRAVGIPCRFHGFTIDKALQKGIVSGIWYKLAMPF